MKLIAFQVYPVKEIPAQIRRLLSVNASVDALQQINTNVAIAGDDCVNNPDFGDTIASVASFDSTPDGYENPLVNVGQNDQKIDQFKYEDRDTGVYNWIAVLVADPINETRSQELRYVATGYTSRADASMFGLLPDDMTLHISDIYGLYAVYGRNALGERVIDPSGYRMVENYVLSRSLSAGNYVENSVNPITISKSAEIVDKLSISGNEDLVLDKNTLLAPNLTSAPMLLTTQLQRPDGFVGAIAKSQVRSLGLQEDGLRESFFSSTKSNGVEQDMRSLGIVSAFQNHELIRAFRNAVSSVSNSKEGWGISQSATFTLRHLKQAIVNPEMVDMSISQSLAVANRQSFSEIEKTDSWVGRNGYSTAGSLLAYELAMDLGTILARNLVSRVSFVYDNRNADVLNTAQVHVMNESIYSIVDAQMSQAMASRFKKDLEMLMLRVTRNNRQRCALTVFALLGTVTRVEIQMDGELIKEFYTHASFMSNRLHAGNTTKTDYVSKLAKSTSQLIKAIEEGYEDFNRNANRQTVLSNVPSPVYHSEVTLGGGNDAGLGGLTQSGFKPL
ncbi:MAG: hypothetical protein ACRDBQ_18535 [Shewanella sp.]